VIEVPDEVAHSSVREYGGEPHLVERLLALTLPKDKQRQALIVKYYNSQFNIAAKFGRVSTKDRVEPTAVELAVAITDVLQPTKGTFKDSDGREVEFLAEVVSRGIEPAITKTNQDAKCFGILLHLLDLVLDKHDTNKKLAVLVKAVDDLRIRITFNDQNPSANLIAAVDEILDKSCTDERRKLYFDFIPLRLFRSVKTGGAKTWVSEVLASSVKSTWVGTTKATSTRGKAMVKLLFDMFFHKAKGDAVHFAAMLTLKMGQSPTWLIDMLVKRAVIDVPGEVGHVEFNEYGDELHLMPELLQKTVPGDELRRSFILEKYSGDRGEFDFVVHFGHIKTKSPKAPSAKRLARAVKIGLENKKDNHFNGGKAEPELEFVTELVNAIAAMDPETNANTEATDVLKLLNKFSVNMFYKLRGDEDHCKNSTSMFTHAAHALRHTLLLKEYGTDFESMLEKLAVPGMQDLDEDEHDKVRVYMNLTRCTILPAVLKKRSSNTDWLGEFIKNVDRIESGGTPDWINQKRVFVQQMLQQILDSNTDQYANFLGDYFAKLARKCQLTTGLFLNSYYDFMKLHVSGVTYNVEQAHFAACGNQGSQEKRYPSQVGLLDELREKRSTRKNIPVALAQLKLPETLASVKSKSLFKLFNWKAVEMFDMIATLFEMDIPERKDVALASTLRNVYEMLNEQENEHGSITLVLYLMQTHPLYSSEIPTSGLFGSLKDETLKDIKEMDGNPFKLKTNEAGGIVEDVTAAAIITKLVEAGNKCNKFDKDDALTERVQGLEWATKGVVGRLLCTITFRLFC
jgi:hypothetical protein